MENLCEAGLGTHNYCVENVLSSNLPSVRKKILGQYVRFFQNLLKSNSPEIVMLASTVGRDLGSVTGKNLYSVECEIDLDPWQCSQKY